MFATRLLPLGLLLASIAPAQTAPELIGLIDATPAAIVRLNPQTCGTRACPTLMTAVAASPHGGTAYDATRGAVWVSNGPVIQAVDPVACRVVCAPHPLPSVAVVRITGLAINEAKGVLIATSAGNIIRQYKLECPIRSEVARCDASSVIPPGHTIGGVATDDINDFVLYSSSRFGGLAAPDNTIYLARRADPCNVLCRISVPSCGNNRMGPLTGVAFDPCNRTIWATDGGQTVGLKLSGPTVCSVQEIQCCTLSGNRAYVGLCIKPSQATAVGQSCTNLGCPNCPNMTLTTTGDPALGNPSFSLDLINAPQRSKAALWIAGGPCNAVGPTVFPFCGPILVPLFPPPVIINTGTGPGVGCNGGFKISVPIPLDRSLCGGQLSSQAFGICTNIFVGTWVSNCLSWTITGT